MSPETVKLVKIARDRWVTLDEIAAIEPHTAAGWATVILRSGREITCPGTTVARVIGVIRRTSERPVEAV